MTWLIIYVPFWEAVKIQSIDWLSSKLKADRCIVIFDGLAPPSVSIDGVEYAHNQQPEGLIHSLRTWVPLRASHYCVLRQDVVLQQGEWSALQKKKQSLDALYSDPSAECDSFLLMNRKAYQVFASQDVPICSIGYGLVARFSWKYAALRAEACNVRSSSRQEPDRHLVQISSNLLFSWIRQKSLPVSEEEFPNWYQPITDGVSIIVLVWNNLDYTKRCVQSILKCTAHPFELIVIDNASSEPISEWFHANLAQHEHVRYVRNSINHGFPQGCNIGIQHAQKEHIVLLNNDTIVTPYWLSRLVSGLQNKEVGLVSGMSTNIGLPEQRIEEPGYRNLKGLLSFAASRGRAFQGQYVHTTLVVFLYVLIRGELLKKIGGLDPIFSFGNCEDSDYCFRAKRAGYIAMTLHDTYIDHIGSASFTKQRFSYANLIHQNVHHAIIKNIPSQSRHRYWQDADVAIDSEWGIQREYDADWDAMPLRLVDFLTEEKPLASPFSKEKSVLLFPHPNRRWIEDVRTVLAHNMYAILRVDPPTEPYIRDVEQAIQDFLFDEQDRIHIESSAIPTKFRRSLYSLAQYYIAPKRFDAFLFQREIDICGLQLWESDWGAKD
ncbi:MAG: glycosyltransferase family 2 protein [Myxococcota bacterium]|nr:glycosyltransferase family 2 protein [Myxococcota bacterium]